MLEDAPARVKPMRKNEKRSSAKKIPLVVEAFDSYGAHNQWQFAETLPDKIHLQLLHTEESNPVDRSEKRAPDRVVEKSRRTTKGSRKSYWPDPNLGHCIK